MLSALMKTGCCGIFVRYHVHCGLTECVRKHWLGDDNEWTPASGTWD
jgi:hypothetical protein